MAGIDESRTFIPVGIAVLTVSDTRSLVDDKSGQTLAERIAKAGHRLAARDIVTDDKERIRERVLAWSHDPAIDVVITTGGTGFTGRDVTPEALEPIFATAQASGKELRIDPLLIIAVIGVESGFNPFSQSVVGAKGLMQVLPRYHMAKLPEEADRLAFLDPVTNVRVGAKVLHESIRRTGGVETGLQQFGGALNDPERRYSSKVLAEKQRLEQAAQRFRA